MKKKNNGFTLIELMVAVGLMVLLLGIVFNIFTSASEVMTRTEATMEMFQNARVIFDIMSQDLTNAREVKLENIATLSKNNNITDNKAHDITDNKAILTLTTTTSWIENNAQTIGSATVTYSLKKAKDFASEKLYYLQRKIEKTTTSNAVISNDIIGEYLVAPGTTATDYLDIPFYIEAFTYNSTWSKSDTIADNTIPPAVRITMTLADEFLRNRQTFSRIFWIPQGK
jgi:prepilin-type N-terminal cleavage/methylation domain-containing protein